YVTTTSVGTTQKGRRMTVSPFTHFQRVAIFGSADVKEDSELYQEAYAVSQALAEQGVQIVNGGGPGVMKAATDGASSVEGKSFTVSFAPEDAPFFEGKERTNHATED